jgi:ABC-type multidrug transport system fused ATPase/permease subunit
MASGSQTGRQEITCGPKGSVMSIPADVPDVDRPKKLRMLLSFIGPHRKTLVLGLIFGIGAAGAGLALPMSIKTVLDTLGKNQSIVNVLVPTLFLVAAAALLGFGQGVLLGKLGERVVLTARGAMVHRLLHAKTTALSKHPGGELVARVTSDATLLRRAAASSLVQLTKSVIMLIGSIVLMLVLAPLLLLVTVGGIAAIFVLVALLMPGLARANERAQDAVGRLGGTLDSVLRAIKTVKASRSEGKERERVLQDAEEAAAQGIKVSVIQTLSSVVAGAGSQLAIMLVLAIGAWQISEGTITVATLVAFLLYALQLVDPVMNTIESVAELQSGVAAANRIAEIDYLDSEVDSPNAAVVPNSNNRNVVEFHNVTATYDLAKPPVIQNLNLRIPRFGHTAIVGPSGAGKTTVFTLLLRFLDVHSGELQVENVPTPRWSLGQLRSKIVYVEQDTPLLPGSLRYNLAYFRPDASDGEIWEALRKVRLNQRFESIQGALDSDLTATTMSGGERQRIALARALVAKPEILLLDEATAQLDGITEAAVQDCIKAAGQAGAVVTIAHRLSTVIDADQIVVMEKGGARAAGTHNELLARDELYRDLIAALRIGPAQPNGPEPEPVPARLAVREYSRMSGQLYPSMAGGYTGFSWFPMRRRQQQQVAEEPWMHVPTRELAPARRRY